MNTQIEMHRDGVGNVGTSFATPIAEQKQGKQLIKYDFVWNNYPKERIETIETFLRMFTKKAVFQEEDEGTPHLQGAMWLKKRARITEILKNHEMKHCSFRPIRSWEHTVAYCTDPKKRIPNGRVFYHNVHKPRAPVKVLKNEQLYDWQRKIITIIRGKPDDRSINWYWDDPGLTGKSTFCKYLVVEHGALVLSGKSKDMFHGIAKYAEDHGDYPKLIVLDIPRTGERWVSYAGIEAVKNGLFFSGKYESSQHVFNIPHLFIFCNFEPCLRNMSQDRWNIVEL